MAETLVFGLTQELLMKLGSPVIQKFGLWYGVKEEFSELQNTVSVIQSVLLDAEEKHAQSNQIRKWLGKLKNAVYDADDLLDDFSTQSLKRKALSRAKLTKKVRAFFSRSKRLANGYKMAQKVKLMRERLDQIASERKFHLEVRLEEKPFVSIGRETHGFVRDEEVIGREEDKEEIIKRLLNDDVEDNVLIIPIIGIGGLGKTTLAQHVYNDLRLQSCFEVKMWVCVSEPFDVKTIVEKMIKSVTNGGELGNLAMDQLQLRLRENIDEKKYLLVLDDVWNESRNSWLDLERLLMGGAKGSRIIVTTRSKTVANISSTLEPYVLNGLSEEKGWVLFTRLAFRRKEDLDHKSAVEIGKRVVEKCVGVPLAIKAIGGLLFSIDPKTEWLSFESKELSSIVQIENDIIPTLKLSYDHLPSHLKNCFAYCKLFPKDTEIDVQDLICLWMAQGYITSSDVKSSLIDIGLQYFKDLQWRSFFQEVEIDELGNYETCKMHDLMHDLAISVGGAETVLTTPTQISSNEIIRHMSVQWLPNISSSLVSDKEKIRTLLTFKCSGFTNSFFSSLTCLRTLKLHETGLSIIPDSIGELSHMRYLDLSHNDFKILPNSICKLVNLQTLNLQDCHYFETFPVDFNALKRLVCLNVDRCRRLRKSPFGLGDLTSLECFGGFYIREDNKVRLKELNGLNQLRGKLRIIGLGDMMKNDAAGAGCLKEKEHLQSLKLFWSPRWDVDSYETVLEGLQPHLNLKKLGVDNYGGVIFASWLSSLTNIVELGLIDCLNLKYLPRLDGLTLLRSLTIRQSEQLEYIEEENGVNGSNGSEPIGVFPSLESLILHDCSNLKGWWGKGSNDESHSHYYFSRLSILSITECPKLTAIPLFPWVEGHLEWINISGKPLVQTIKMKMSLSSSFPLSKLTSLYLTDIASMSGMFQHLTSLEKLAITNLPQLISLPDDISTLTSLQILEIRSCEKIHLVSGMFQHLTSLKELTITNLPQLISLPDDISNLTSLRALNIESCENLCLVSGMFQQFTSLEKLTITHLPQLISLPDDISTLPSLRALNIGRCENLCLLSGMFQHLTSLEKLTITHQPQLISLPDDISTLPSLRALEIESCEKLHLVSGMFQHLTSLETLTITNLPQMISLPDAISTLTSLRELRIWDCSNLISLCEMRALTSLQLLYIRRCPELISLPDDISTLTSLQHLLIRDCPKLISLPDDISTLTSLQELWILDCPYLWTRYQEETGEERHKIAHIPHIRLQ